MYRGVFTVGIALIGTTYGNAIVSANALTDYSYVNARDGNVNGVQIARCVTGLGPSGNDNSALGGLYFNGSRLPYVSCGDSATTIQPVQETVSNWTGVINIIQCTTPQFSAVEEGVYTCVMMNSSMMNEILRFGVYFFGRCESLNLH